LVLGHAGYQPGFDHGIWTSQTAFVLEKAAGPVTVAVRYYGARETVNETIARMISTETGPSTAFAWRCMGYCSLDDEATLSDDYTTSVDLPPSNTGKQFLAIFTYNYLDSIQAWDSLNMYKV
jgi:hypothetical protein